MQQTVLIDRHRTSNGKLVDFHGWEMPLHYQTGIIKEHLMVRSSVGVFDVSHMGDFLIYDSGGGDGLQSLLTNDIINVKVGKGVYTHLPDKEGRIIDDLIVTKLSDDGSYFCVPNASMIDIVGDWMRENSKVELIDLSPNLSCIAVQGPRANDILLTMIGDELREIKRFSVRAYNYNVMDFTDMKELSENNMKNDIGLVSRTGYTGEAGFELVVPNAHALKVWDLVMRSDIAEKLPIGLGARDTLRLEMGFLLSGLDFSRDRTSLETNCAWVVKWDHDFMGKEFLEEQRESNNHQKMIGIALEGKAPARPGAAIHPFNSPNETMGSVSSGNFGPSLSHAVALAYVDREYYEFGSEVILEHRGRQLKGVTTKTPFIKKK